MKKYSEIKKNLKIENDTLLNNGFVTQIDLNNIFLANY